jgi:hypothetical protein
LLNFESVTALQALILVYRHGIDISS